MDGRAYTGGSWDWLTPFSFFTGLALVLGYILLGATWLIYKTEGPLQSRAYAIAFAAAIATLAAIGIVSLWTPFLEPLYFERWFSWPQIIYTLPVPLLVAACAALLFLSLRARRELAPFLASLGLFILSYAGIGISFYPYIVPPKLSIWDAAAPPESQAFLLVGAAVLVPIILIYTAYAYWVFRGKVGDHGYH
jgi:cytochrome d ubiquinol oxidase subunit II